MTTEKRSRLFSMLKKLGIGSGITIVGIAGGIWWAMGQGCEKVIDPHIAKVASVVDSIALAPVIKRIDLTEARLNKKDTVAEKTYFLLMEIASSDQKTNAENKRMQANEANSWR